MKVIVPQIFDSLFYYHLNKTDFNSFYEKKKALQLNSLCKATEVKVSRYFLTKAAAAFTIRMDTRSRESASTMELYEIPKVRNFFLCAVNNGKRPRQRKTNVNVFESLPNLRNEIDYAFQHSIPK